MHAPCLTTFVGCRWFVVGSLCSNFLLFAPRSEAERIRFAEAALLRVNNQRDSGQEPLDSEDDSEEGPFQLHRAAAAAGYFRPPLQERATGQDRTDLLEATVNAILAAPVLLDLAEALPEWDTAYGALGIDLPTFLKSRECTSLLKRKLMDGCLLEVKHGTFVRLPSRTECQASDITLAMEAGDGRTVAAIVLARLLREPAVASEKLLRQTIADGYTKSVPNAEYFVLQAIGALPRQVGKVVKECVDIIASGYLRLERSRAVLVDAAFSPSNAHCLNIQIALKRLGHHFAVEEWKTCSWQSAATTVPGPVSHVTKVEKVIPEDTDTQASLALCVFMVHICKQHHTCKHLLLMDM